MPILLKDVLTALTVPDLKDLASHLPGEKPTRKNEIVDFIAEAATHLLTHGFLAREAAGGPA